MKIENLKRVIKIAILIGMISFLFPFVLVSCSGGEADMTGIEMMINTSFDDDVEFEAEDPPNYYLWIAFGLGIAGIILTYHAKQENNHNLIPAGASMAGGAVFLLIFRSTFEHFYGLDEYGGSVSVKYQWGWVLALIAYITASAAALLSRPITMGVEEKVSDTKSENEPQITPERDKIPKVEESISGWSCKKCGKVNKQSNNFCIYCAEARPVSTEEKTAKKTSPVKRVDVCTCGAKLKPGAKFCVACGREVASISHPDGRSIPADVLDRSSSVRIRMSSAEEMTTMTEPDTSGLIQNVHKTSAAFKKPASLVSESKGRAEQIPEPEFIIGRPTSDTGSAGKSDMSTPAVDMTSTTKEYKTEVDREPTTRSEAVLKLEIEIKPIAQPTETAALSLESKPILEVESATITEQKKEMERVDAEATLLENTPTDVGSDSVADEISEKEVTLNLEPGTGLEDKEELSEAATDEFSKSKLDDHISDETMEFALHLESTVDNKPDSLHHNSVSPEE